MKFILIILITSCTSFSQHLDESVSHLANYILSEKYQNILIQNDDLSATDSIYAEALRYHKGDISEALLTTAFATLAFEELPVRIPILDIKISFPLAHVDDKLFNQKIESLPKRLFFNSPKTNFGDKDKIAHFFGSAFLSNGVTIFNLSKFMGIFIEVFEDTFKVEGFMDFRDMIVNNLGELYGASLNENPNLMPSQALQFYNLLFFRITN